jgi:hypothetical protein
LVRYRIVDVNHQWPHSNNLLLSCLVTPSPIHFLSGHDLVANCRLPQISNTRSHMLEKHFMLAKFFILPLFFFTTWKTKRISIVFHGKGKMRRKIQNIRPAKSPRLSKAWGREDTDRWGVKKKWGEWRGKEGRELATRAYMDRMANN